MGKPIAARYTPRYRLFSMMLGALWAGSSAAAIVLHYAGILTFESLGAVLFVGTPVCVYVCLEGVRFRVIVSDTHVEYRGAVMTRRLAFSEIDCLTMTRNWFKVRSRWRVVPLNKSVEDQILVAREIVRRIPDINSLRLGGDKNTFARYLCSSNDNSSPIN